MKAVVFHGIGDIRLDEVEEPRIQQSTDAIVRLTASAICGTDLHMVRGTMPGMKSGRILGHEGVGIVEEVGADVRNLRVGDRVIIPSTIACGACSYCRSGYTSQCDNANPNGPGTAFFGGPEEAGGFDGLQAEKARVPFANVGLVKIPDGVSDDQAILLSDIFPTGWFGAVLAEVGPGDTVAVFGCGPVGQFAIASAKLQGAVRVFAVDCIEDRLDLARAQGAEAINFDEEDPVETIKRLTYGVGVDRAIDAVGVDSVRAHSGPAAELSSQQSEVFDEELEEIAPDRLPAGKQWQAGDGPSQASRWAVEALAKAGTLSIIGVYPQTDRFFSFGAAMMKNLTINMGNCNHRPYIPRLLDLVVSGVIDPTMILTQTEPLGAAIESYKAFDRRESSWLKVKLEPQAQAQA